MFRKSSFALATAAALVMSGRAIAGGPPWLCVPVDGVTKDTARACSELLTAKLGNKVNQHFQERQEVRVFPREGQWYAAFYMGDEDVRLSEIEAALEGSSFSVPRERIHMFGHVMLEIDAKGSPAKELLADLEALEHALVIESKPDGERLLATVAMPYPTHGDRDYSNAAGWGKFEGYMEEQSVIGKRSDDGAATARELPSLQMFQDIAAKHKAAIKHVRWSVNFACRSVGCVAVPKDEARKETVAASSVPSPSAK